MTTKFRINGGQILGGLYQTGNGATVNTPFQQSINTNYVAEKLISQGHPFAQKRKKTSAWVRRFNRYYGKRDVGGPFSVQRREVNCVPAFIKNGSTNSSHVGSWWDYNGAVWHESTPNGVPTPLMLSGLITPSVMNAKGTIGWAKYKPTKSQVGIGQTLGELRTLGGLPINAKMISEIRDLGKALATPLQSLRGTLGREGAGGLIRPIGSAHLGYQFGVKPFVKDLQDLSKAVLNFDKRLAQLARDNGRGVRRKGRVSMDDVLLDLGLSGGSAGKRARPILAAQAWNGITTASSTRRTSLEFWFSARFRYWLDPTRLGYGGIPTRERHQLTRILYGIDPTNVHLIWQLMPWSWLIDWVVPLGPLIDNLVNDHTDHLTADYAYIMGRSVTYEEHYVEGSIMGQPFRTTTTILNIVQQRAVASPYGFGLSFTGFSLSQLAILAALGVTRG